MKTKSSEDILKRVIREPDFRREICVRFHYWFFHTYFTHHIKYPGAEMHKQMLYFSGTDYFKKLIVQGFPQCGKSVIHCLSLPIWSLLKGKKSIAIIFSNSQERIQFRDRFEQELQCNKFLKQDFGIKFRRKGHHFFFSRPEGHIYIGNLEKDTELEIVLGEEPDLIVVDSLTPYESWQYEEVYYRLKQLVEKSGNMKTRKIIVGRGGGKRSPLNRLIDEMIEKNDKSELPCLYPFATTGETVAWAGKFPDPEAISHELEKTTSKESFFYEYFLLNEVPDLPLMIRENSIDDTYPISRQEWKNLSEKDKEKIEEIFIVPYQGNQKQGALLWGVLIKEGDTEKYIYQDIDWVGEEKDLDIKSYFQDLRVWLDGIKSSAMIIFYADEEDPFGVRVSSNFQSTEGGGRGCMPRNDVEFNKTIMQCDIDRGKIFFSEKFAQKLQLIFSKQNSEQTNHWIQHIAISTSFSVFGPVIVTSTVRNNA